MQKRVKHGLRVLGSAIFAAILAGSMAMPANAWQGGGSNPNPGGGVWSAANMRWKSVISPDENHSAWGAFISESGYSEATVRNYLARASNVYTSGPYGLISVCTNSDQIWWVSHGRNWVYDVNAVTYPGILGAPNVTGRNFGNPIVPRGNGPSQENLSNAQNYLANKNTHSLNIYCSGMAEIDGDTPRRRNTSTSTSDIMFDYKEGDWTHPYSWTTSVRPQILRNGIDPIGKPNLNAQVGTVKKTNFGVLSDAVEAGHHNDKSVDEMRILVDQAVAKDAIENRSRVDLNDGNKEGLAEGGNKEGLAEGGVLNVDEHTKYHRIDTTETHPYRIITVCNTTQDGTYNHTTGTTTWGPVQVDCQLQRENLPPEYSSTSQYTTQRQTGFWQILSVHCNAAEFNSLVNSTGATVQQTGDADRALSAVAYSKKYAQQPNVLDFGQPGTTSGELKFYNKECPFQCTSDKDAAGASNDNKAKENINGNKPSNGNVEARYGALSGTNNTADLSFFRDNVPHIFKVDTWFPRTGGVVSYDGHKALTTTVTRWKGGTPGLTAGENGNGGEFSLQTVDSSGQPKDKIFNTAGPTAFNQRNWDPRAGETVGNYVFANGTSALLDGFHNTFAIRSTFASDANKPVALNVKWEYAPQVSTRFSTSNLGYGPGGSQELGTIGQHAAPIQGKCFAEFGRSSTSDRFISKIQQNTGEGVPNGIDGKLMQGESSTAAKDSMNLLITFVRATTE